MESGNDYLDNLWHLTMYYAASSQGGRYPGRFINGLWTWNHDVQNWNFYFHWNQQQTYWPLQAAGHHPLVKPYLDWRFAGLDRAREAARKRFGAGGAFVGDVADRRGNISTSEKDNHTPVAEIALDFWRHYRFTGDTGFLKERAWPYIREAADFFARLFVRSGDGLYHARCGTAYEGWIELRDVVTDLAYGRKLLEIAVRAASEAGVDEPAVEHWKRLADRLAPPRIISAGGESISRSGGKYLLRRGAFKGGTTFSDRILASGFGLKEKAWLMSRRPAKAAEAARCADTHEIIRNLEAGQPAAGDRDLADNPGIFPVAEWSLVFPSGLVGLREEGTELFKVTANTARLYAPEIMGWDPLPIVFARLGLAEECWTLLERMPGRWQFYANGFGHYGPRDGMKFDAVLKYRKTTVLDAGKKSRSGVDEKFHFPAWPFRHMGMESMSVLACALNETLLQSHEDCLRVGPAVRGGQDARFTLHAAGGFIVSAEIRGGIPAWIYVESTRGNQCTIRNPWKKAFLYQGSRRLSAFATEMVSFPTRPGEGFMLTPDVKTFERWKTTTVKYPANSGCKTVPHGDARLGLERHF